LTDSEEERPEHRQKQSSARSDRNGSSKCLHLFMSLL